MSNKNRSYGFTIIELLSSVAIISTLLFFGIFSFNSFFKRMEINNGLRAVTSSLSLARYKSIRINKNIKFSIMENTILMSEKNGSNWETFFTKNLDNVTAGINSSPVFHPTGIVSPLCTISISNRRSSFRITISIAGRIKIRKIF